MVRKSDWKLPDLKRSQAATQAAMIDRINASLAGEPAECGDTTSQTEADRATTIELRSVATRLKAARKMIRDLCRRRDDPERRDWTLSIPAQPFYDPDIVISDSLNDIPRLVAALADRHVAVKTGPSIRRDITDLAYEVAKGICRVWGHNPDERTSSGVYRWETYLPEARAAIGIVHAHEAAAGWLRVPDEQGEPEEVSDA